MTGAHSVLAKKNAGCGTVFLCAGAAAAMRGFVCLVCESVCVLGTAMQYASIGY